MRNIDEIIIHCSATPPDWYAGRPITEKAAEIKRWHLSRGFSDIGYHLLIDRDGVTYPGRPVEKIGAHVKGHNANSLGFCLIGGGGSSATDRFEDNFTPAQADALKMAISSAQERFPTITKISGHNQYAAKACPGFNVPRWLNNRPAERASKVQSTTLQATAATAASVVGAGATAVGYLDERAQILLIGLLGVALLGLAWIARERIKRWAAGDR